MTKKKRKRVVGDYIIDKINNRPRGREAVMKFIEFSRRKRRVTKESLLTDGYEQKKLIFHTVKTKKKSPILNKGDVVRISIKTQYGIGRIGKIDGITNERAYVNIIFRDGIFIIDFPFKFFEVEKANKKEKEGYETLEEGINAKEVADKL